MKRKKNNLIRFARKNKDVFFSLFFLILFLGFLFLIYKADRTFYVHSFYDSSSKLAGNSENNISGSPSPISGLLCENYARRPVAVMLVSDTIARPLSGLTEADLVVEMPVVQNGITRMMAVYVCNEPKEIGSIRSARHDFIPLAMGFDAIYAHWGGSHFALDKLDAKIMDNINALTNPFDAYYRKSGIYAPHNGFTSIKRLIDSATKLGYRLENKFEGYLHENPKSFNSERIARSEATGSKIQNLKSAILKIGYPVHYAVEYKYDAGKNSYFRWRGGKPEMDKNNNSQVEAKNIVVMRAKSRELEGQYNDVDVEGEGKITVFQNGEAIEGAWEKDKKNQKSKLYFFDSSGQEIKFIPGQIWIEIIEPDKSVVWNSEL